MTSQSQDPDPRPHGTTISDSSVYVVNRVCPEMNESGSKTGRLVLLSGQGTQYLWYILVISQFMNPLEVRLTCIEPNNKAELHAM